MKMNKFVSILTLAFSAFAAPQGASAAGDIMDIRCVDEPGVMVFGTANVSDPFVCKPDRPLTIGDTLTIRVRMFTRNWEDVKGSHGANLPKTWTFKPGLLGGSLLAPPKLSILVGSRIEGATYADSVIVEGQIRESGKPLVWDELGNPDANYTYYTDLYFQYKIKAGDLGMPITLVTNTDGSFALQNVDQTGVGQWMLVDTETTEDPTVHYADFRFVPETEEPDGWPNCGGNARKLHFRTTDLSDEGAFVKTMDFGPDDSEGAEWRNVYPGLDVSPHADPEITLNGSLAAEDNVTVYVWTESEDVAVPVGGVSTEIAPGYTRKVLAVTIKKGEPSAKFKLAGAEGAAVGAETTVYLCAVKKFPEAGTAVFENTTVQRTVKVVKAPQPTVHMYIDGTEATKTVTADDNYIAYKARLTFKVIPKVDVPVTVTFDGSVSGDDTLGSLDQIFDENVLRIADSNFGGDPIEQKKKSVTIQPETGTAELNVYVLGTTAKTSTKGVYFSMTGVSPVGSGVVLTDAGCTLKVKKGVPRIVSAEPMFTTEDGEGTITTVSGSDVEFALEIADTYRNLYDEETGYTFMWKSSDGEEIDPEDGITMDDGVFTGSATFFNLGTRELTLQVKAPDGSQSAPVKYTLVVSDSKKTTIAFTDPNRLVFCEGEETTLKLGLTQPYKGTGYIFLDGDAEKLAYVDSLLLTEGALVEQGKTEVATPRSIRFLDGTKDLTVKALLCSDETDKTKKVTTFVAGTLSFTVTNKPPTVTSVTAAGQYLDSARKGQTLPREVPMGVAKTFTLTADDVPADLTNALFATKWVIEGKEYEVFGDPSTNVVTHTFLNATPAGDAGEEVRVYLKDKDMSGYPANPSFYFYVKVAAKPHLDLTTSAIGGVFNEDDTANASVTLTLSEPASAPLLIKLTVQDTTTGHFRLRLAEGSVTNAIDAAGNVQSNVYLVTINEGVRVKNILATDMDGTNDTYAGLDLNAEVISEETTSEGVAWKDYYTPSETVTIRVKNVPPAVIRPNDSEVAYTNMNASANTPYTISFGANDVKADLAYEKDGQPFGLAIDIAVDGVSVFTTNATSSAVQTTQVTFDGEGDHVVVITFTDKDQESSNRELNFYVQPSKRLKLSAHGPAPALGSSGGFSQHYASAPGLGAGRVWAGETGPQKVANFIHSYSFTLLTTAVDGWAYGYSADGKPDDGTLTPAPDRGIDSKGGWVKDQVITAENAYNYSVQHPFGKLGYDSFVYGWACNNTESESGGGDSAVTKTFVLNVGKIGHLPIPLPKEEKDAKSYPEQSWEAIFSRELLTSDNCGDINLDGIPDVVLMRYGLGIVDPNTQTIVSDSSEGDLKDVSTYNLDENDNPRGYTGESTQGDFLPTTAVGLKGYEAYGIMAAIGSWDEPFTAVLEIRGAGTLPNGAMPLNDAFAPEFPDGVVNRLAFPEVESDSYYLDPDLHPTSTLSRVEWLAWQEYAASHDIADPSDPAGWRNAQGRLVWSPERPTLPTKVDTDGDGFPDGYEYYYWYRAHVGYMDGEIHRYLTGRRYDERNPGEGRLITREEIEHAMDPLVSSGSLEQDTDNDGLPDLLEMFIGTNPFDFDTDGDGLPDGWELCNVGNLDPLEPATHLDGKSDTLRNSDGDAMAIGSFKLEQNVKPVPFNVEHAQRTTFAVIDPNGDTDGVQWYAVKGAPDSVAFEAETNAASAWSFEAADHTFVYAGAAAPKLTADGRLAQTLAKAVTFVSSEPKAVVTNAIEMVDDPENPGSQIEQEVPVTNYVATALYPVRLEAGTPVKNLGEKQVDLVVMKLADEIKAEDANACWIYGRGSKNALYGEVAETAADYGCLALGRQLAAEKGAVLCALPSNGRDVAFLHYLCYQEFGFDPRTAWKAKDPLAKRWSKSVDGQAVEGITVLQQGGYTCAPTRTRDYCNYDEFLVYSFFVNNGCDMTGFTQVVDEKAPYLVKVWGAFTTNPQGPNEKVREGNESTENAAEVGNYGRGTNGADTDFDGVPDGWELYVMAGPKTDKGAYVFANPYAGFVTGLGSESNPMPESYFSPFLDFAKGTETSNQIYLGGSINDDGLNEFHEFEGTDSIDYYSLPQGGNDAAYSTTVAHDVANDGEWKWINKFFPTDPWNVDTDGDGLNDKAEGENFVYGTPADDGILWNVPGGGLNPNSVDTDRDGLPDPWEVQFKGQNTSQYTEANAVKFGDKTLIDFAKDAAGNPIGNALQGLTDGMDGTVADAYSYPISYAANADGTSTNVTTYPLIRIGEYQVAQVVNRDYDRDGLENWQEYLTGTMRCWRYDDPFSPWSPIPGELYWKTDEKGEKTWKPDLEALAERFQTSVEDMNEFWYKTLVDKTSPLYNPNLVTDTSSGAQYFSRVTNAWDSAYIEPLLDTKRCGAFYWFYNRIGDTKIADLWAPDAGPLPLKGGWSAEPKKYACCSPIDPDSDHDGMDDYWELFHGMNPLLGRKDGGQLTEDGPADLIFDAWANASGEALCGWAEEKKDFANYWQLNPPKAPRGNGYDFVVFPWLNGIADADPDGDVLPNQEEALLPKLSKVAFHADPTPLWMTDSSSADSLVKRFFRLPTRFAAVPTGGEKFTYGGETYRFSDYATWLPPVPLQSPAQFAPFIPDAWKLAADGYENWICSFEENEGYDSDHDGISDFEEKEGRFNKASDPQYADSPRRRQAMYFAGPANPSALQTMPFVRERPPTSEIWPDDMAFIQFTAECWVKPEVLDNAVILERAVWTGVESPADAEYMRKNFFLAIQRDGDGARWCAGFDPIGTADDTHRVQVLSKSAATTDAWTHLAVTYDGTDLVLYVNGQRETIKTSGLPPSWGASAVAVTEKDQGYWFDREHALRAIIVGASAKTQAEGETDGHQLDVTGGCGWDRYARFYTGWIDEIRIWDGARTQKQIGDEWRVRYDDELAKQNRTQFYDEWKTGARRYAKDGSGKDITMTAELRFHWSFDSVFGADNEGALAVEPHGFGGERALLSRPDGYAIPWWQKVLDGYAGTVYDNPAWVCWIPNTVAHLPRFDGTTLDSFYWSHDFQGGKAGTYAFANTSEPVSFWTQMERHAVEAGERGLAYYSTGARHLLANMDSSLNGSQFALLFQFTGRNLNQTGDDLVPLGGAYAKACNGTVGLWDGQGASTPWEITGHDTDGDGLPDWWADYADENYRGTLDPSVKIGWETVISYHGMPMTAGEAYLRDLARGVYVNEAGEIVTDDDTYRQTADEDRNGIPDWWEDMYGIRGESGLADHDNDGLPNYVEYLLSEVFALQGVLFDPTDPCSVDGTTPDYFFRVGEVYVGEIFTDHDLVDDAWEDLYADDYASRLAWDALADADEDGWSNRSENRYSKAVMPIVADQQTHFGITDASDDSDGRVADYPIPTLSLTLSYDGARREEVSKSPIVVKTMTLGGLSKDCDAIFQIAGIAGEKTDEQSGQTTSRQTSGKDDTNDQAGSLKRMLGKWSDRHAIGTLTPGYVKQESLLFEFAFNPSADVYEWTVEGTDSPSRRGSLAAYQDDLRKYGSRVELVDRKSDYHVFDKVQLRSIGDSTKYEWFLPDAGLTFGTVDVKTGEFDIDLGVFKGQYTVSLSNAADRVSMEDQTFRISYWSNMSAELPRKLYLGEATHGHVREGKNMIVAWADLDADGLWQPGEPYGLVRDVDISWKGTKAEIELTDTSAITPRIDLVGGTSDQGLTWAKVEEDVPNMVTDKAAAEKWIANNKIVPATLEGDSTLRQRIRVVRWLVNDVPVYSQGIDARVVLDKTFETDVRSVLTEADFLADGEAFDLESKFLASEVEDRMLGTLRSAMYLVVVGDGEYHWTNETDTNTVSALDAVIVRRFGESWVRPTPVTPGSAGGAVVNTANPTFKWTMDCPDEEGYTAFRINVFDAAGKTKIWDSGLQDAPKKVNGVYAYEAPLFVGDKTLAGAVFANKTNYTWKVAMYNAKYSNQSETRAYSAGGLFRMEVQENGYSLGTANVAVRYFGPSKTWAGGASKKTASVIRVRAYASPDFTGVPVAAGYVTDSASVSNRAAVANCRVTGLPAGKYYLQAFVDSNNNGSCEPWETQGYLCTRDGSTPDWLNPTAITFGEEVGQGDTAVIYLEDADTDGDGLPDGWEYAEYGSLTAQGVNLVSETEVGERLVNAKLSGEIALQANAQVPTAGLAGRVGNMLKTLASPAGVAAATGIDPADIEVSDGGLVVKSEVDPDSLTIVGFAVDAAQNRVLLKVGAETTADVNAVVANLLNITVKKGAEVTVKVEHALSPTGPWQVLPGVGGKVTVDRAGADIEVQLSGELPAQGYFRAKVEE